MSYPLKRLPYFILISLLTACAADKTDLEQFVAETKNKYQGSVEPLPQFEPYQNYVYNASELRPPFTQDRPQEQAPVDNGIRPDQRRRKEPLEFFPVDALEMVGILEQQSNRWGLIKDPDGSIHRVQPGNYVGENYGQVTNINETEIVFLEIIPDGLGAWIERQETLAMGEENQ